MTQIPPWCLFLIVLGVPCALWPYEIALLNEVIDSIGRKPAGPVEPAEWLVAVTRMGGIVALAIGLVGVLGAVL